LDIGALAAWGWAQQRRHGGSIDCSPAPDLQMYFKIFLHWSHEVVKDRVANAGRTKSTVVTCTRLL